ncbi:MAG: LysE family translocator [Desulfobulbales bacterium]|nr:LysE family translocator [Desulfobulbales bacterium]
MLSFLTTGTVLGLSAGFAPGPLLALVVAETLQHDIRAGIKIALAPIFTDLPIIIITLFILAELSRFQHILGVISITGACFISYLGIKNIKSKGLVLENNNTAPKSLQRGILVNVLSPHPYLFWFSVGGPLVVKASDQSLPAAISFIVSFYVMLVGSKIVLALLVGRSRSFLLGKKYIYTMQLLGVILLILAGLLFLDSLRLLQLL